MRIILASASPRRRELLSQIGLDFEVIVSEVEEKVGAMLPEQVVEELSARKAEAVLGAIGDSAEDVLVIGADTVVALDGQILGKPGSPQEAAEMLRRLSGRNHGVYTGVAHLYRPGSAGSRDVPGPSVSTEGSVDSGALQRKIFHERTDVAFFSLAEEEIAFYVATGDCMDKAGAYGIQGMFARYVKGIAGDYNNVVGLPVGRLYQEAKEWLR